MNKDEKTNKNGKSKEKRKLSLTQKMEEQKQPEIVESKIDPNNPQNQGDTIRLVFD